MPLFPLPVKELLKHFARNIHVTRSLMHVDGDDEQSQPTLKELSLDGIAQFILSGKCM